MREGSCHVIHQIWQTFDKGTFIKDCVIALRRSKNLLMSNAWPVTPARRIVDILSDIHRQLGDRGVAFDYFSLACDESTDASDTAQLLMSLRVYNDMNITKELLDVLSLKGQTRGIDYSFLFVQLLMILNHH